MAFTCGFFDSLSGDRKYNAKQISEIFDGVIRDGVYMSIGNRFLVEQGTGMQITVNTGRAWFNHTWTLNDAKFPLTVDSADLILDRIDAVVLEVDSSLETRNNKFKIIKGTPALTPQKPKMTNTEFIHQYALAYIRVKKGATSITTSDIEINVGKSDCPFVTSILEAADISSLYAQWEFQFRDWENEQKTGFEEWFISMKDQLSEDAAGNLQLQVDEKGIQVYTHSKEGTVHKFTGTGPNGRALMTSNVATGDTFQVNGSPVIAYMGADNAVDVMAGSSYSGKWVSFIIEDGKLNFKGGGGGKVTVSGLSAAAIKTGVTVTVKQGAKTVQTVTGTFTNDGNIYNSAVLENLVGYSKGQRIVGTMPNRSSTIIRIPLNGPDRNVGAFTPWGNGIAVVPAIGYYGTYSHVVSRLEIDGPELASAVGLTPAVLKAGTTVLGVAGALLTRAKAGILHAQSWSSDSNFTEMYQSDCFSKTQNNVWTCTKACQAQLLCIALSSGGLSQTSATVNGVVTTATVHDGGDYHSIVMDSRISQVISFSVGMTIQVAHRCTYHTNMGFIVIYPT